MPTECEGSVVATTEQQLPQQQQQSEKQDADILQKDLNAKMEDKDFDGEMSTSQTSTTSSTGTPTNGHSGSSNGNGVGKKAPIISPDPTAYVAKARVTRPTPPPPSYNPMQFVQIKPCNLYQTAQEQLKKAEEVKKIKEIKKEEPEDWQNNLDNWKSSRRKRVEHIIDRVVEVKKLELEEHDRSRRKSKTFSEMIEERGERGVRGRVKLASLAVYNEDESNDLSDLGIGTSSASGKSSQSEDYDNNSVLSDNAELDKAIFESNHKPNSITREYISSPGYDTSSSTAPGSSPDPCEYTYEGAIQDYKQRVSRATAAGAGAAYKLNSSVAGTNNNKATASALRESTPDRINNGVTETYPTRRGSKIEDRLIGFEVTSPSDCQEGVEKSKVDLPKIDISKRKEIFESANQSEVKSLGNGGAVPGPVPKVTLRDRFKVDEQATAGAAGKSQAQESTLKREVKRLSGDITSIRDRMQSLEQQNLVNSSNGGAKSSTAKIVDIPVPPLKDRLSSLQNAVTKEDVKKPPVALVDARQLEIMKTEEETAKQRMKQLEKEQPIKQLGASIEETTPVEPAVDRDDSGIHTADDIDTDAERMAEELQMQSEQEQQLNAAIAALALEEKQLEEAANAVNQIEAEFAELSHAPAATTNEPPCEMEFSINEALELALEAIDNESKLNINDTLATTISTTTTTTATRKLSIMSNAQGSYNNSNNANNNSQHGPHSPSETPNKTDEEKELKSQQMNDEEHADDAASREALISQEPIYENISTASTRQVDAEAIIIPKTITNNQNHNQIVNNINQNQNSGKHMRNSHNNNNNNNNPLSKPTNNSNSNSNCNNHNNTNNNIQNLVDLTNAFANATSITNKTTTITNTDLIATENEMATLNTIANTTSTSTITTTTNNNNHTAITTNNIATETVITSLEPQQQQQQQQQPTVETTTTTILPQPPPQQQQQQITNHTSDPEPYYQVPKSVEPYYDAPKHLRPIPLYENIEIFYTGPENAALATSSGKMEPPKEKPPPPPIESPPPFDDVDSVDNNTDTWSSDNTYETISSRLPQNGLTGEHPSPPIKRMNSTKRIKKELRNKRSSFLGIDPNAMDDEDSYLELTVAPPPDMAQLLQEERRLEKQLYLKAGLCDSSDTGESRDSGVSENHSRQSSEHYTNSSEENDHHIESPPHSLKVSEVIYHNDSLLSAAQTPLLQTVKGNSAESWTESATVAAAATKSLTEATATATAKMISIEEKIREQEEVLRVERELLQLEQEELKRQRENLMLRESMARRELQHGAKMLMSANRRSLQDLNGVGASMSVPGSAMAYQAAMPHHPLSQTQLQQPHPAPALPPQQIYANVPNLQQQYYQMDTDYRKSMSDLQEFSKRLMLPPTPPTKPMRSMHVTTAAPAATVAASTVALPNGHVDIDYAARQRHSLNAQSYGGSLVKIATPTAAPRAQIYANHNYHHHQSAQNLSQLANVAGNNGNSSSGLGNGHAHAGNMSRNTLHALSATPKPKYTDGWVQVQNRKSYDTNLANDPAWLSAYQQKRKSMPEAYHAYNNHWLVQEAEQRRIAEQQRRTVSTGNTPIHQQNGIMAKASVSASASAQSNGKPLPDSIIQTLTERVQSKGIGERKRFDNYSSNVDKSPLHAAAAYHHQQQQPQPHPQQLAHGTAAVSARRQHGDFSATANAVTALPPQASANTQQDKVLSVSGKKKCSHCGDELGRGAAMIIESLLLFYHINCFKCCVCHVQLGDGLNGTDVRVRNHKLHCQNCYSSDDGIKFSCV